MTPSAADYAWVENEGQDFTFESCLTLVKGLSPEEVIQRIGGTEVARLTGIEDLEELRDAVTVSPNAIDPDGSFNADAASTGKEFVAVAAVPGGALMLEQYGFLGVSEEVNRPLSRGTVLASAYFSENNDPRFVWVQDGDLRLDFNPFHAAWREGSDPDAVLSVMKSIGFNFSTADVDDPEWVFDPQASHRAFALVEHLTGIRLTQEVLENSTYLCASVPPAADLRLLDC